MIIPLVVSHAPEGWAAPTSFHQLITPEPASIAGIAELVPSFRILVEDLAHLTNEQLRARALSAFDNILKQSTKTEEAIMTMTAYDEMVREGQVKVLRRVLVIKFSEVPSEYLSKLDQATEQQLERFTARILSAQTIEEVFADPT